jgi:hypothetical protein
LPETQYAALPVNNFIDRLATNGSRSLGFFHPTVAPIGSFFAERRSTHSAFCRRQKGAHLPRRHRSQKREQLIERLLEHPSFADFWATNGLIYCTPNPDRVGVKASVLDQWLREFPRKQTIRRARA